MPNTTAITRLDTFIKLQDLSKGHYSEEGVRTYQRLLALRDKWKNRTLDNAFPQSDDLKNRLIASGTTDLSGLISVLDKFEENAWDSNKLQAWTESFCAEVDKLLGDRTENRVDFARSPLGKDLAEAGLVGVDAIEMDTTLRCGHLEDYINKALNGEEVTYQRGMPPVTYHLLDDPAFALNGCIKYENAFKHHNEEKEDLTGNKERTSAEQTVELVCLKAAVAMAAKRDREINPLGSEDEYKIAAADNGKILYYRQLIEDNPELKIAVLAGYLKGIRSTRHEYQGNKIVEVRILDPDHHEKVVNDITDYYNKNYGSEKPLEELLEDSPSAEFSLTPDVNDNGGMNEFNHFYENKVKKYAEPLPKSTGLWVTSEAAKQHLNKAFQDHKLTEEQWRRAVGWLKEDRIYNYKRLLECALSPKSFSASAFRHSDGVMYEGLDGFGKEEIKRRKDASKPLMDIDANSVPTFEDIAVLEVLKREREDSDSWYNAQEIDKDNPMLKLVQSADAELEFSPEGDVKLKSGETVFSTDRVDIYESYYETDDLMNGNVPYKLEPESNAYQSGRVKEYGERRSAKITELQLYFPTDLIAHQAYEIYKDEKYLEAHGAELSASDRDGFISGLYAEYISLEKSLEKLVKNCDAADLKNRFGKGESPFDKEYYKDQLNMVRGRINGLQNGWHLSDAEFLGAAGNVYERAVEILNDPVRMQDIMMSEESHLNDIKDKLGVFVQENMRDGLERRTYEPGERRLKMNEALNAVNDFVTKIGPEKAEAILGKGVTGAFITAAEKTLQKSDELLPEYQRLTDVPAYPMLKEVLDSCGSGSVINEARSYGKNAPSFASFYTELENYVNRMPENTTLSVSGAMRLGNAADEFIASVESKGGPSKKEKSFYDAAKKLKSITSNFSENTREINPTALDRHYEAGEEERKAMEDFLAREKELKSQYDEDKKNWELQNIKNAIYDQNYFNIHNDRVDQLAKYNANRSLSEGPYQKAKAHHDEMVRRKRLTENPGIIEEHEKIFDFNSDDRNVFKAGKDVDYSSLKPNEKEKLFWQYVDHRLEEGEGRDVFTSFEGKTIALNAKNLERFRDGIIKNGYHAYYYAEYKKLIPLNAAGHAEQYPYSTGEILLASDGVEPGNMKFMQEYGRACTMLQHLKDRNNRNYEQFFGPGGAYKEYTFDRLNLTAGYKMIPVSDFDKLIKELEAYVDKNTARFDDLTRKYYVKRVEKQLRADFEFHMNYDRYASYDETKAPNRADYEHLNPTADPYKDWEEEQKIISQTKADLTIRIQNARNNNLPDEDVKKLQDELEDWNKIPTERPDYTKKLKVPEKAPVPVKDYSVRKENIYSRPDKKESEAISEKVRASEDEMHARRDNIEANAPKVQRDEANCPDHKWLKKPNATKIILNETRAIQTFRDQKMSWDEISGLDSASPGFSGRYWSSLTPVEKRVCGPEKYHDEWKKLPWEEKMATDPSYTEEQWNAASYNEKAELNLNKTVELIKEEKLEWSRIKNFSSKLVAGYWKTLSPEDKAKTDPGKLREEQEELKRYQEELKKQEAEAFRKMPLSEKIDKVGEETAFRYAIVEQGVKLETVKAELGEAAAERYWQKAIDLSSTMKEVKLHELSEERFEKDIWDKENGKGAQWAWNHDFDGMKKYWNDDSKLTMAERFRLDRQEAINRYSMASRKVPFEKIVAAINSDREKRGLNALSGEEKNWLLTDYYNSKEFTVADRKAMFREEYDRRWNTADWNAKKTIDPERANALWGNASYEEKKELSPEDAKEFFKSADKEVRYFLDPEGARQDYYKENPLARLYIEKKESSREIGEYIDNIQKNNGKVHFSYEDDGKINRAWRGAGNYTCFEFITECLVSGNGSINELWFMSKLVDREKQRLGDKIDPDLLKIGKICKDLMGEENIEFFENKHKTYSNGSSTPAGAFNSLADKDYRDHLSNALIHRGKVVIPDNLLNHLTDAVLRFNKNNSDEKKQELEDQFDNMLKGGEYVINRNQTCKVGENGIKGVYYLSVAHDTAISQVEELSTFDRKENKVTYTHLPEKNQSTVDKMDGSLYEKQYKVINDAIETGNYKALSDMAGGIKQLSDQWNAQRSHRLTKLLDSTEYTNMETAHKNFITAFDKVIKGESISGGTADPGRIKDRDLKRLHALEHEMQKAADAYIKAKRVQKKGGLEAHSTEQGKDRLAMADILSEFKLDTLMQEYVKKAKAPEAEQGQKKYANESIRAIKLSELESMNTSTRKANARDELEKRRDHLTRQRTDGSKVSDVRAKDALKK